MQVRGVNSSALSLHFQDAMTDAVQALNGAFTHLVSVEVLRPSHLTGDDPTVILSAI